VTAAHCISEPVTTSFPIIELNLVHPKEQGAPVQAWHYENPVPGGAINNECLEYEQDPYRNPVASNGFWEHWNSNDGSNACMMANFGVSPAPYSDGTDPRFDFGFFFEQILAYKSMEDIFVHEEGTYDYIAWKGDAISQSLDVATLKPFSWSVVSTKGVENMLLYSRFSWNLYRQAEIDYLSSNPESAYARFLSRLHAYKGLRPVPFNIKIEDSPKFYIPISKTGEKDGIFDKPPFPGFAYELSLLDCEKEFQPPHEQIFSHYVYVNPGKSGEFPFTQQDQNIVTKEDTLWCKPDNIMEKGGMSGSPVIYFLPGSNEPYVAGVFTMGYGTQQKDIWNGFSDPAITSQFFRLKLLG